MLDTLIRQLGQELKMEDLIASPEPGHYSIPFADDIQVECIQSPHSFLLKGVIGPSPQENSQLFLTKAMQSNLFGHGTRGAAIGLNNEGKMLTLALEIDSDSNYKEFHERLEDFISILDFWRKEAAKHK